MLRRIGLTVATLALVGGCMKPPMPMEPPKKPTPAPEMKKLERMIGSWASTAELTPECKQQMMKHMPPGSKEPPSTFAGGGKMEWTLGGLAVKAEGWYDMGEGQKGNYVEYWMWDAKAKKFHTWMIDDWGKIGSGWAAPCPDCDGFCMNGAGSDADGNKLRWEGCMRFVDKDTREWQFTESGPMGEFSLKGTDKRQK